MQTFPLATLETRFSIYVEHVDDAIAWVDGGGEWISKALRGMRATCRTLKLTLELTLQNVYELSPTISKIAPVLLSVLSSMVEGVEGR